VTLDIRAVHAYLIEGSDTTPETNRGYLKAVIDLAMEREDVRRELAQYVENRS
jgi:UTP-glucose-1-phosphate uridylyltransferase